MIWYAPLVVCVSTLPPIWNSSSPTIYIGLFCRSLFIYYIGLFCRRLHLCVCLPSHCYEILLEIHSKLQLFSTKPATPYQREAMYRKKKQLFANTQSPVCKEFELFQSAVVVAESILSWFTIYDGFDSFCLYLHALRKWRPPEICKVE